MNRSKSSEEKLSSISSASQRYSSPNKMSFDSNRNSNKLRKENSMSQTSYSAAKVSFKPKNTNQQKFTGKRWKKFLSARLSQRNQKKKLNTNATSAYSQRPSTVLHNAISGQKRSYQHCDNGILIISSDSEELTTPAQQPQFKKVLNHKQKTDLGPSSSSAHGCFIQQTEVSTGNPGKQQQAVQLSKNLGGPMLKRKATNDIDEDSLQMQGKRKHLIDVSDTPFSPAEIRRLFEHDKVSQEISLFLLKNQQKAEFLKSKLDLMRAMQKAITYAIVPEASIHLVGSSVNGFGRLNSDSDMCLVLDPTQNTLKNRRLITQTLLKIKRLLQHAPFVKNMEVIPAKVPILRFSDKLSGMCCDLNVNNLTGVRNTYLLFAYARYDPRVRALVLCVKEWAHQRDFNDASRGTLSSYALVLMVLHYLQCGTSPQLLPSLQKLHPELFAKALSIDVLEEHAMRVAVRRSENRQSLSELLGGFFEYFAFNFRFNREIMSVRAASRLPVNSSADMRTWQKVIKIEEPFDLTNVARACQDRNAHKIMDEFRRASRIMEHSDSLRDLIRGAPCVSSDRYFDTVYIPDSDD